MKNHVKIGSVNKTFPVIVEKDEKGFYVAECPIFKGCYTQAKSLERVMVDIKDVIEMCIEEKDNKEIANSYDPEDVSLHSVRVAVA